MPAPYDHDPSESAKRDFISGLLSPLGGVWHWFSIKRANRYLCEIGFRWNRRQIQS